MQQLPASVQKMAVHPRFNPANAWARPKANNVYDQHGHKEDSVQEHLILMNNDRPNRYDMVFPLEVLTSILSEAWRTGTPSLISHDAHRPFAWSAPYGLGFHNSTSWLIGRLFVPSTALEEEQISQAARAHLAHKLSDIPAADKDELTKLAEGYLTADATFLAMECSTLVQKGIARTLFPHLFPERENDKRGLVPLSSLKPVAPGVYEVRDGVCVFAHRFLRRSASHFNNLNSAFLERFQQAASSRQDFGALIALDPDSIGLVKSYRNPIELAYWWGPQFSDSFADIPLGIARHAASDRERLFHRIDRTEFWWHMQNDQRSFECEEVVDGQTLGLSDGRYACRYVHSMVDAVSDVPHHLDGAMRIYDDNLILHRMETNIAESGRQSEYVKLWRVDGKVPVSLWKSLVSDYFRDNHLVSEYLAGKNSESLGNEGEERPSPLKTQLYQVPYPFQDTTPPVAFVSIHPPIEGKRLEQLEVVSDSVLHSGEEAIRKLDLHALDLIKTLKSSGLIVKLCEQYEYIAYEDQHAAYPRIRVHDSAAGALALSIVAEHLRDKCRNCDRVVTVCFDFSLSDAVVRLAAIGHGARVAHLLDSIREKLPSGLSDTIGFFEEAKNQCGRMANDNFILVNQLEVDGSFRLGRTFANDLILMESPEGPKLKIPLQEGALGLAIEQGKVRLSPVFRVQRVICSTCGESYIDCGCIGAMTINLGELLGWLWALQS